MQKATLWGIVQGDYGALMGVVMPLTGWGLVVVINLFGVLPNGGDAPITAEEGGAFFLYFALFLSVISVPLLIWRVRRIQGTFARGEVVEGVITAVSVWRGRGTVRYRFQHNGQQREAKAAIATVRPAARALRAGQMVRLVVDPQQPQRAFIQALYG